MIKTSAAITLAAFFATVSLAQTSTTTPRRSTAHRSTSSTTAHSTTHATKTAANPADTPPNVPAVQGTPKPLYALRYIDTLTGTGALAQPQKFYTVRYTGWLTDGTKFDSSEDHPGKEPITFPYGARRVIPGWDTGFEGMHVGGKRRLYIPYQLAYGETGHPPVIPAKSDLIFDIELVAMSDKPPAEPAQPANPTQPATQPADPTKPTSADPSTSSNPTAPQSEQTSPK